MNLPNKLTVIRLIIIPFFLLLMVLPLQSWGAVSFWGATIPMAPVATAPTSSNSSSPILNEHDYSSRLEKIGAKLDALIEKRVVVDGHSFANTYERYGIQQRRKISNYSERGLAMNVKF